MRMLNWLHGFRQKLSVSKNRTHRVRLRRHRTFQPIAACIAAVESLEPRTLLSAVTWTGDGGDMNWNTAANWSTNNVPNVTPPGAGDDVTIPSVSSSPITVTGARVEINSLNSCNAIEVTNTGFLLQASSTIGAAFQVDNGASLNVSPANAGIVALANGATGDGTFVIAQGAALEFRGTVGAPPTISVTPTIAGMGTVTFVNAKVQVEGGYDITG